MGEINKQTFSETLYFFFRNSVEIQRLCTKNTLIEISVLTLPCTNVLVFDTDVGIGISRDFSPLSNSSSN